MDSISWAKSTDSAGDVATTSASAETRGSSPATSAASWHPTNVGETLETWGAGKKVRRGLVE